MKSGSRNLRIIYKLWMLLCVLNAGCGEISFIGRNDTMFEGVVRVVNELGNPVEGANVEFLFSTTPRQQYKENMGASFRFDKVTDADGNVNFRENSLSVLIKVMKEEYWISSYLSSTISNKNLTRLSEEQGTQNHYEIRVNPTIVLTRKINPRPMIAGQFTDAFPKFNVTYAFDCSVNDWVRPHGKGIHKDILFIYEGRAEAREQPPDGFRVPPMDYDVSLTLEFPNEGDGILPVEESEHPQSQVLLGRVAPKDGYQKKLVLRVQTGKPYHVNREDLAGYWFRVRSRVDSETGEIQGHYGKIKGNFSFSFNPTPDGYRGSFKFNYMFSPDEQRSMEYNGENLLPGGLWDPRGPGSR